MAGGDPPRPALHGRTAELASARGVETLEVSLSHVDTVAGACVVAVARSGLGVDMECLSTDDCAGVPLEERAAEPTCVPDLLSFHGLSDRAAVFTPSQVRELDRATIEDVGLPGVVLMERAALGVSALVQSRFAGRHTLIVCGPGNNGGDGLAAAGNYTLPVIPWPAWLPSRRPPDALAPNSLAMPL